jgi:replicative DNA helicase
MAAKSDRKFDFDKDLYRHDSESFLAGAMVINGKEYLGLFKEYLPDSKVFSSYRIQRLFESLLDLEAKGMEIDIISLCNYDPQILTIPELTPFVSSLPASDLVRYRVDRETLITHCKIVMEAYVKRELYSKMVQNEEITSIMDTVAQLERSGTDKFFKPKEIALQVIAAFDQSREGDVAYPFMQINRATNGIHKGQVVIIAGRPSAGKSTFVENVASYVASKGKKVLFASAEMPARDIGLRIVSRRTGINMFYANASLTPFERNYVEKTANDIADSSLYIHEFESVAQLEQVIKDKARDFDLVCVDYLQLIKPMAKTRSRYEEATAVANEITRLAKKYHLPFLVAAQFNRNAENNQPTMADLKESGQIEQNADVIISLWQDPKDGINNDRQMVRFDVLKNRNGYTIGNYGDNKLFLYFNKKLFQFIDPSNEVPQWR